MSKIFKGCWQNYEQHGERALDSEREWIERLNRAVFERLERELAGQVELAVVEMPAFIYDDVVTGERNAAVVTTQKVFLPEGPEELRAGAAFTALCDIIGNNKRAFFYWPIVPLGNRLLPDVPNRSYMGVRVAVVKS